MPRMRILEGNESISLGLERLLVGKIVPALGNVYKGQTRCYRIHVFEMIRVFFPRCA